MPSEESDGQAAESAIHRYHRKLITKSFMIAMVLFGACLSTTILAATEVIPSSLLMLGIAGTMLTAIWAVAHLRGIVRVELHPRALVLASLLEKKKLRYDRIERLHYRQDKQTLKIEMKSGKSHQVKDIGTDNRRMLHRLEAAVYGHTV